MVEQQTALLLLGSAIGGAKTLEKILGPTAAYIGEGLKSWTERRIQNVARIFQKATVKLGDDLNNPGSIPPRVLKEVLDEGSYCDDELTAEYFAGVLASGRSPNGRDDRAATYLKLTSTLSTYEIRLHYIAYTIFRMLYLGTGLRPMFEDDLVNMSTFYPVPFLAHNMDFTEKEPVEQILVESTMGLRRHFLSEVGVWGTSDHVNKNGKKQYGERWIDITPTNRGFVLRPTQFGIDYYLWATGNGKIGRPKFLNSDLKILGLPDVRLEANVMAVLKSI